MSGNFVSPKICPWGHSQSEISYALKFEFQRLRRYGFLTFKIKDQSFDDIASLSVYSEFIRSVALGNVGRVTSGDHGGQFCGQPRPIHVRKLIQVSNKVLGVPSLWKCICNHVFCRSWYTGDSHVLRKVQITLNLKSPELHSHWETDVWVWHLW